MNGMEMMLKAMGMDPAKIMAELNKASEGFQAVVKHFDARLDAIEKRLEKIEGQNPHEVSNVVPFEKESA